MVELLKAKSRIILLVMDDEWLMNGSSLLQLITESTTSVTALFFYHGVKKEIETWKQVEKLPPPSEEDKQKILQKCKISISKYAKAILLCKSVMRSNSSLEILIVGDQETYQVQEVEKETFALIRLKGWFITISILHNLSETSDS